jgi:hypothetical protein
MMWVLLFNIEIPSANSCYRFSNVLHRAFLHGLALRALSAVVLPSVAASKADHRP